MGNKISNFNNKTFLKYISSYIFILLIMIFMGINLYKIGVDIIKEELIKSNLSIINNIKDELDTNFKSIDTMALQISTNPVLNKLSKLPRFSGENSLEIANLIKQIYTYSINQKFIDNYYIYFKMNDSIITNSTLYRSGIFYSRVLNNYDIGMYNDWLDLIGNMDIKTKYINMDSYNYEKGYDPNITIFRGIGSTFTKKPRGAICIYFNKNKIKEMFSPIITDNESFIFINDIDNNKILSISGNDKDYYIDISDYSFNDKNYFTQNIDGKEYLITSVTSEYNKWSYTIGTPSSIVLKRLTKVKTSYINIFVIFSIVGILSSFMMAYGNSKSIIIIANQIRGLIDYNLKEDLSKDAIYTIKNGVSNLISQNSILLQDMEEQKPFIYAAFLDKLIKGFFINKAEIYATAKYLNIELSDNSYVVILIKIYKDNKNFKFNADSIKEFNMSKTIVKNIIISYFDDSLIHELDHQTIALITNIQNVDKDFNEEIPLKIDKINSKLHSEYNIKIHTSAGEIYKDLTDIWQSYEQAAIALSSIINDDCTMLLYKDLPKDNTTYYYPIDLEQHLIDFNKAGDLKQVNKIIEIIYNENYVLRNISKDMSRQLMYELKNTFIKLVTLVQEGSKVSEDVKLIKSTNTIDENFTIIKNTAKKLCELSALNTNKQTNTLITKIKKYIDNNYFESNLCLNKISSEFNVSEGYFSYLFKEQTGINFTDYLEKTRIDKACELLKTTDININDIASNVGYNSAQSFRRAFKKTMGINPTALRKI